MSLSDSYNTIVHGNFKVDKITGEILGRVPRAGDEHGTAPMGLSTCHNTRKNEKKGVIKVYIEGSLLHVSKNRLSISDDNEPGARGKITGFSKKSRSRLMRKLAMIKKTEMPLFITLTYPSEFPVDPEIYKSDLDKFIKRMKYRFPKFSGFWKLEFQKRGAPHYHLLVWGLPNGNLKNFISLQWYKVVNSGDEKHLKAGTQVAKVRSWRGVMSYASKYMGKEIEKNDLEVGRYWGVVGVEYIPWSKILEIEVSQEKIVKFMRLMRRYARIKSRDYPSLSIYINHPDQWIRALSAVG